MWKEDKLVIITKATYPAGNKRETRQIWTRLGLLTGDDEQVSD